MRRELDKLSPQLRKALIRGASEEPLRALVELAPGAVPDTLTPSPEDLGATVRSWSAESRLMTLSIPGARLVELAACRQVLHVQGGDAFRLPDDEGEADAGAARPDGIDP